MKFRNRKPKHNRVKKITVNIITIQGVLSLFFIYLFIIFWQVVSPEIKLCYNKVKFGILKIGPTLRTLRL